MTSEEKLKAIIEAQVKGGYERWKLLGDNIGEDGRTLPFRNHFIEFEQKYETVDGIYKISFADVLFDTAGCKAAYGEEEVMVKVKNEMGDFISLRCPHVYMQVSQDILDAWHSEEGNNWKAAIDTAYNLLPK